MPWFVMMPVVEAPPVTPFTCQITAVLLVLLTVAAKAWACPTVTETLTGVMTTLTGLAKTMVTVAEAEILESALETAVTVTVAGDGTVFGAV